MSAEAESHGREHLFAEGMLLPRAEAGVQRRGKYVGRDRFFDRGLDGPAALAGILDKTGEILQLRVLRERGGTEIEQPGGDDTAAPPDLRDIRQVQCKALILRQVLRILVAKDIEALGISLHQSVLDAVMHHLDEVAGAGRTGMNVAAFGTGIAFRAARRTRNIAQPRSECCEDRVEAIHCLLRAAYHHAVAAIYPPDAARRATVDVANALVGQFFGATDIVFVE